MLSALWRVALIFVIIIISIKSEIWIIDHCLLLGPETVVFTVSLVAFCCVLLHFEKIPHSVHRHIISDYAPMALTPHSWNTLVRVATFLIAFLNICGAFHVGVFTIYQNAMRVQFQITQYDGNYICINRYEYNIRYRIDRVIYIGINYKT